MKLAAAVVFCLVATAVYAQDLPLGHHAEMAGILDSNTLNTLVQEKIFPSISIPEELVSKTVSQPLPAEVQPEARPGDWIAEGEALPVFPVNLVIVPHKNDGRWMGHVERIGSCAWCGEPLTWKQAAFDKKSTSLWALRSALFVADIEITHNSPCFQAHTCREGNPLLGQTRTQAYAVSGALTALDWLGTAYLRKGNRSQHVGGYKYWYIMPIIGQASSAVGILMNLARWNER
jgi:hypothetical protein